MESILYGFYIAEMTQQITCICLLLDESGSMGTIKDSVKRSILECKQKLSADGECYFSLYTFSSGNEDINNTLIIKIDYINSDEEFEFDYLPGGMTGLYDAQMAGVNRLYHKIKNLPKPHQPNKVVFVTVTDGEENDSCIYNSTEVKTKIQYLQDTEQWQFVYLGANQDSFDSARQLGVSGGGTQNYVASDEGISLVMRNVSRAISAYRTSTSTTVDMHHILDDDDDDAAAV